MSDANGSEKRKTNLENSLERLSKRPLPKSRYVIPSLPQQIRITKEQLWLSSHSILPLHLHHYILYLMSFPNNIL